MRRHRKGISMKHDDIDVHPANVEQLAILMSARFQGAELSHEAAQKAWDALADQTARAWRECATIAIRIVTGQIDAYITENARQLKVVTEDGVASRMCFVLEQEDAG